MKGREAMARRAVLRDLKLSMWFCCGTTGTKRARRGRVCAVLPSKVLIYWLRNRSGPSGRSAQRCSAPPRDYWRFAAKSRQIVAKSANHWRTAWIHGERCGFGSEEKEAIWGDAAGHRGRASLMQCKTCKKTYGSETALKYHYKLKHGGLPQWFQSIDQSTAHTITYSTPKATKTPPPHNCAFVYVSTTRIRAKTS